MEQILKLKEESEAFQTEFEVLAPSTLPADIEAQYQAYQTQIAALTPEIERLTNHADGIDYAAAVSCGIVTGMLDALLPGAKWDFREAKAWSNKSVNMMIQEFAEKDPEYKQFCEYTQAGRLRETAKDPNRLSNAVEFLEKKYKLPGDSGWNLKNNLVTLAKEHGYTGKSRKYEDALQYMNTNFQRPGGWDVPDARISASSHHLEDFCHHPTFGGLVSCICVQFTGVATYHSAALQSAVQVPVTVNDYGQLVGNDGPWKLFSGVINWFFCAAQTIQNRQGHLLSDMAGTKQAVENQRSGAGLPGGFLSTLEELSTLPCMQDAKFSRKLRSAYMNGIGTKESQVDLGVLNSLFEGASNKLDVRTERAVSHNLQRQAWPALLNTVLVRACYFIRQFIRQMKEKKSLAELDWKALIPANNRTVTRMLTIATGTFMAVDLTDAAIRAAAESKGQPALFVPSLVLRINFVGIGRFVIAIGTDVGMGLRRASLNQHRLKLYEQQLSLMLDTRLYYQLDSAWVAVERADQIIGEMEAVTRRNAFKYLAAVSGEIAVHANAIAVTAQQMGRQAAETNAPLQRAADASERTQRLLTAAEEKQKMLEQLLEELK